jgi:serine protease Do
LRETPIVQAVSQAKPSIVNINGQKTIPPDDDEASEGARRVNGMGTGVVIDERGYVITNYHVVEGVRRIQVTLYDSRTFVARLVAHDPQTDLAIIHIPIKEPLPLIKIGTSRDLMEGERVVAIGNAFGYPHTVTCGFISALNRSVQVSDTQKYHDLIQTDASINPGNSGGPLLNIDGEMIGINVAVRVGAQGISFAIPVDRAMEVAAELMSVRRLKGMWHGIEGEATGGTDFTVTSVGEGSPASGGGLEPGDVVRSVKNIDVHRQLDLERALLDAESGDSISVNIQRNGQPLEVKLVLAAVPPSVDSPGDRYWRTLGLKFEPVSEVQLRDLGSSYKGGLRVTAVRSDSPAALQGIRLGDVLVGMHKWETVSLENISYILNRPDLQQAGKVKFYVVRGAETLYGHLPLLR